METAEKKLQQLRKLSLEGGGTKKIQNQQKKGKNSARDRINLLLDRNSFVETDAFVTHKCTDFGMKDKTILGDGVITGMGTINGNPVYIYSQDFTVFGGSLSSANAKKITKIMQAAQTNQVPIIGLNDSGGARIHEGVASLGGYADIFYQNVKSSGIIPQISLILGPCAGGAVYSPAITDFIFMVDETSNMFITGPDVIEAVTGEKISFADLGGSETHSQISGVIDARFPNEEELFAAVKLLMTYIPPNNQTQANELPSPEASENPNINRKIDIQTTEIENIVPSNAQKPYRMHDLINNLVDPDSFFELKKEFAHNIVTGLARLGGVSVGIVANNPKFLAGALDINASQKAARFIRFCDAFNIPLITLVDVPGFLPGKNQEHGGIIKHGAKLLYAYAEATVPKLTVIIRKAYGGAYDVMSSKHIGADLNLAWPNAEIAVMGAEGACNIIFRQEIQQATNPQVEREKQIEKYHSQFNNPYIAASLGFIDAVIFPCETRTYLIKGLQACKNKKQTRVNRKHGNIPL